MALNEIIAKLIRNYRQQKQISQEDLAHRCGLDRTYVSGVERAVRNITLESLEKIIRGLDIEAEVFFKDLSDEIKIQNK